MRVVSEAIMQEFSCLEVKSLGWCLRSFWCGSLSIEVLWTIDVPSDGCTFMLSSKGVWIASILVTHLFNWVSPWLPISKSIPPEISSLISCFRNVESEASSLPLGLAAKSVKLMRNTNWVCMIMNSTHWSNNGILSRWYNNVLDPRFYAMQCTNDIVRFKLMLIISIFPLMLLKVYFAWHWQRRNFILHLVILEKHVL